MDKSVQAAVLIWIGCAITGIGIGIGISLIGHQPGVLLVLVAIGVGVIIGTIVSYGQQN